MGPFQLGTAVAIAYDENGMLGVQADSHGDKGGGGRYVIGAYGLIGRPLNATDPSGSNPMGAACLYADEGHEGFAWLGFDPRDLPLWPVASNGSSGLANSRGSYFLQDYDDETTTIHVRFSATSHHEIKIGKVAGKNTISITHCDGMSIVMEDDEIVVNAPTVHVNSPNVLLGPSPGKPVACVNDLVVVSVPALVCPAGSVIPVNIALATPTGGIQAMGKILSGRAGILG